MRNMYRKDFSPVLSVKFGSFPQFPAVSSISNFQNLKPEQTGPVLPVAFEGVKKLRERAYLV